MLFFGWVDEEGRQRVAVRSLSFGEYVEMSTTQILRYSGGDPAVIMALQRFASILQGLDLLESDSQAIAAFAAQVKDLDTKMTDPQ